MSQKVGPILASSGMDESGFTLVETLMVMVTLGIAAIAIVSLQSNIFTGQSTNKSTQVGVELIQECAETILAKRRQSGYTTVSNTLCSGLGNYGTYSGVAPTVTLKDASNTTVTTCPSTSATCTATITISGLTAVTLQLAKY